MFALLRETIRSSGSFYHWLCHADPPMFPAFFIDPEKVKQVEI